MNVKIGRNDPCWCESGKKFKYCHLNRDKARPLSRSDLEAHGKKLNAIGKCLAQNVTKTPCGGRIVRAHTVSKSGSLKKIAVNGHVLGSKPTLSQLIETQGKMVLTEVGINSASTFSGFCAHHDKTLFAPLEDEEITLSDEQLFLLAYRSVARELFAKEKNTRTADLMKEADRGRNFLEQLFFQSTGTAFAAGVDRGLQELNYVKNEMDQMLASREYQKVKHFVIEFSAPPSVLVSSITQPEFDFKGNRLQSLGSTKLLSQIIFNCISYEQSGCFVFSWLESHEDVCRKFIDTLASYENREIANALVRFSYSTSDNTWASPRWWDSLATTAKDDIQVRLQHGLLEPATSDILTSNGIEFNALVVDKAYFK